MALAAEMRRLCESCVQDHDNRVQAVMSIRTNAARTVADLEKAHRNLSSEIRQRMRDLDAARRKMASEQHRKLTQFHNNLHESVMSTVHDLESAHSDRAREISNHIHDMGVARHNMGVEQQRKLTDEHLRLHATVKSTVRDLERAHSDRAREMEEHIHDMGVSRHNMGVEQQRKLSDEHLRLEETVSQMRGQLADDVDKAHQAWSDFTRKMKARRSGKPKSRPISTHAPITATAKDLSTIPGIGPGRQQKLREMGIDTVAQLANADPVKIRAALGPSGRLANVEEWIEEAARKA